jgi:integrase
VAASRIPQSEIGSQPISEITVPQLLAALRKIEKTGKFETAHKSKELAGRVFMFAIAEGDKGIATPLPI